MALSIILLLIAACATKEPETEGQTRDPPGLSRCDAGTECAASEVCGGPHHGGPYYCLAECPNESEACGDGGACRSVVNADCPACRAVTLACWPGS